MIDTVDTSEAVAFLQNAMPFPGECRFLFGTFERGVTVYRQQIRALNLIYSFVVAGDQFGIRSGSQITVVGGGAFGTTVAAAAAFAKFDVVLLERHQTLLHLQRGCDTRWLHPRFYDWPAPESESRRARLPFLDWDASSAGHVAVQIERSITELAKADLSDRLRIDLRVSDLQIERTAEGIYEVRYSSIGKQRIQTADIVVYAVGFGVENNLGDTNSYWRNDRFGQSDLSFKDKKVHYVVSGFGDGGLVDLFRLTIQDFRYERIFGQMFPDESVGFMEALNQIRKFAGDEPGALYDKLVALESGKYRKAIARAKHALEQRIRTDTAVTLNGQARSFRQGLLLKRISFSNALLAYLLFSLDVVKYQRGSIDTAKKSNPRLKDVPASKARPAWLRNAGDRVICRHGTNLEKALREVGCGSAIDFLQSRSNFDSGRQIYQVGWWPKRVAKDWGTLPSDRSTPVVEYVPPVLMTHATTFVATLASILEGLIDRRHKIRQRGINKLKFRVTLHRLARFDGQDVFQQVTPYKGRIGSEVGVGRFFPVKGGIVGLACRTGSLVVARKRDPKKFRKIWKLTDLKLSGAEPIKPYVDSLLCCPFFAPESQDQGQRIILALFVDSADAGFFDDEALQTISSACRGFVDLLESLYEARMLYSLPSSDLGFLVHRTRDLSRLKRQLQGLGVKFVDASHKGWKDGLTFRTVRSVDLQVTTDESEPG